MKSRTPQQSSSEIQIYDDAIAPKNYTPLDRTKVVCGLLRNKDINFIVSFIHPGYLDDPYYEEDNSSAHLVMQCRFDSLYDKPYNPDRDMRDVATLLALAIILKTPSYIDYLIKDITDINIPVRYGTTLLMIAAVMDDAEVLNKLLQKGADISAKHDSGKTSLDYAKLYDSKECIKVLQAAQKSRHSQRVKHQTQFFSPCQQPAVNESNDMHVSKRVCR